MGYIGKVPTAVPITTSDLADGLVTTSKIANDAVNASKFDETDNYAFTGTVSGAGAGAWEVVNSTTSTSTSTAEVTGFDNGNNYYWIKARIEPLTESASNHVMCQFGTSGGYVNIGHSTVTEIYQNQDNSDSNRNFSSSSHDGNSLQMVTNPVTRNSPDVGQTVGVFHIYTNNPNQATMYTWLGGHGNYHHTTNYSMRSQFIGIYSENTQFTKAKIFLASGNSFKCTVTLYGSLDS